MKLYVPLSIAVISLVGARLAREVARDSGTEEVDEPYAPSPGAAPIVACGYREVAADLLFARLLGYYGGEENTAQGIAEIVESISALDPQFRRIYDVGGVAMQSAQSGVDNAIHLRAAHHLEEGAKEFPDNWKFPNLAGQIYLVDLQTEDPKLRAEWNDKGTLLLETAARKPGAPAEAGLTAATLQSKYGQTERAIAGLKEMLLVTSDDRARERLLEELAKITTDNQDEIASEFIAARKEFDTLWHTERPALPASFYILLGKPQGTTFDLKDLSLGGRQPVAEPVERLPVLK